MNPISISEQKEIWGGRITYDVYLKNNSQQILYKKYSSLKEAERAATIINALALQNHADFMALVMLPSNAGRLYH